MLVQTGLCRTCSETTLLVFPRGGSNDSSISALNILETIQSLRADDDDELNVQCDVFEEELNADSDAMESMNDGKVNLNDHMSVFNAIYKRVGETAAC